jgi:anti-anti-sigma regulatory factor
MARSQPLVVTFEDQEWDLSCVRDFARVLEATYQSPDVIVDMSIVTFIDCACLTRLITMRSERAANGFPPANLVISSILVRRLFGVVKFDTIWPIFDSLEAALRESTVPAAS